MINVGCPTAPGSGAYYSNPSALESTFIFGQQNNDAPPPYPGPPARFCSQCDASQQDLSAKFCSSCGKSFNKN